MINKNLVVVEKRGPITIISINRKEVKNAVDRPTATQLFNAFNDFEKDVGQQAAILHGIGGTFCAGADLSAQLNNLERINLLSPDMNDMGIYSNSSEQNHFRPNGTNQNAINKTRYCSY